MVGVEDGVDRVGRSAPPAELRVGGEQYRRAARRCGCRFAFTEMVDAASLAYSSDHSSPLLYRSEDEDFLGTQLVGSDPEHLAKAVEIIKAACV